MADEAVTPDLVELTRLRYEIMDRDLSFDAIAAFYLPDAVMDLSHSGGGRHEGVDAIGAALIDYWRTWEEHHHYVEEILDLGHGVVFSSLREDGRVRGSDSFVEGRSAWVTEWVDGKVARTTGYAGDTYKARAAAERLAEERAEAATPDLVDVFRRLDEAMSRGDVDAVMAFYAPDAVWDLSEGGLGTTEGVAAIRSFFGEWASNYEEIAFDTGEIRDLGNGVSLSVVDQRARPRGSAGQVAFRYAAVTVWADGLIARVKNYTDRAEAHAAAERLAEERG